MKPLQLTQDQRRQIEREASAAYPNECCGIIYGSDVDSHRQVRMLEPVANVFDEQERYHRFSISPQQLMEAERKAGEQHEMVLGFYHSHPDHPAHPSEYDRVHAWPFYSYVIVAVSQGQPQAMTSWLLDDGTEQFAEQPIQTSGQ